MTPKFSRSLEFEIVTILLYFWNSCGDFPIENFLHKRNIFTNESFYSCILDTMRAKIIKIYNIFHIDADELIYLYPISGFWQDTLFLKAYCSATTHQIISLNSKNKMEDFDL